MNKRRQSGQSDQEILLATDRQKERFWAHVTRTDTCWLFAKRHKHGYGVFALRSRVNKVAHRVAKIWDDEKTPFPDALACHTCRERACVRPSHIYWGTQKNNSADAIRDGTTYKARGTLHKSAHLSREQCVDIVRAYDAGDVTYRQLAEKHHTSSHTIGNVIRGVSYQDETHAARMTLRNGGATRVRSGERAGQAKFTEAQILEIYKQLDAGLSRYRVALNFQISQATMHRIALGLSYRCLSEKYKFSLRRPVGRRLGAEFKH